jgi:hypothetical protein
MTGICICENSESLTIYTLPTQAKSFITFKKSGDATDFGFRVRLGCAMLVAGGQKLFAIG